MFADTPISDDAEVVLVNDEIDCRNAIRKFRGHCNTLPYLGFDCESDNDQIVALLQLCSPKAYCVLIHLCHLPRIPQILRDLLMDPKVIKVGVGAYRDALFLLQDHGVKVERTLDLRFSAVLAGYKPQSLREMYKEVTGKTLIIKKYAGSWRNYELTERQKQYAAQGARAGMEIYTNLTEK